MRRGFQRLLTETARHRSAVHHAGARRRLGPAPVCRCFSAPSSSAAPGGAAATSPPPAAPPKPSSGIIDFLGAHIGKIALGGLVWLIGYMYRNSENRSRSTALRKAIEERRPVEPWEIDELRVANEQVLTRERFRELAARVMEAFPDGVARYADFIKVCTDALAPQQVRLGHYVDRVVLRLEAEQPVDERQRGLGLLTLLCALSLGLDCEPAERAAALHDVLALLRGGVDVEGLEALTHSLMATSQLPAEKLVLPEKGKEYPFQQYRMAQSGDLVQRAAHELNEKGKDTGGYSLPQGQVSVEELVQLLSTGAVCVWGECYHAKRNR